MLRQDGSNPDSLQQETRPAEYARSTWKALTTLATEHQHALRHAFDSNSTVASSGEVCQQTEAANAVQDSLRICTSQAQTEPYLPHAPQDTPDIATFDEAVQTEVQRVKAYTSTRNPEKDVVVRLEFMRGTDSRVCCLASTGFSWQHQTDRRCYAGNSARYYLSSGCWSYHPACRSDQEASASKCAAVVAQCKFSMLAFCLMVRRQ